MPMLVNDPDLERRVRRRRRLTGADRWDEVWEGVYIMSPSPNNQHQGLSGRIAAALLVAVEGAGLGRVFPGCNVSDRRTGWRKNYRCPDVAVFLKDNPAEDCGTHWFGGPDLAIEIVSPRDRSRRKLPFYGRVGTREVLMLDRDPWRLELFRLTDGALNSVGGTHPDGEPLQTESVPFAWRLTDGPDRPVVTMTHTDGRLWTA